MRGIELMIDDKKEVLRLSKRLIENTMALMGAKTKNDLLDQLDVLYETAQANNDAPLIIEAYSYAIKTVELLSEEELVDIKAKLVDKK